MCSISHFCARIIIWMTNRKNEKLKNIFFKYIPAAECDLATFTQDLADVIDSAGKLKTYVIRLCLQNNWSRRRKSFMAGVNRENVVVYLNNCGCSHNSMVCTLFTHLIRGFYQKLVKQKCKFINQ